MRFRLTDLFLVITLFGVLVWAVPPMLPAMAAETASSVAIAGIDVQGNQRIEALTIQSYMTVTAGDPFDPQRVDQSLKALFATGLGATEQSGRFVVTTIKPTVYVAGIKARVQFSGKAPGFEGLNQVNIEIPEGVPGGGPAAVVLQSGKRMSNEVTLPIE